MFELALHSDEIPANWMGIFICPVQKSSLHYKPQAS